MTQVILILGLASIFAVLLLTKMYFNFVSKNQPKKEVKNDKDTPMPHRD